MRRATQQQGDEHDTMATQGAFSFGHEPGATVEAKTPAGRRASSISSPAPRAKRAERVPGPDQPTGARQAGKQSARQPAAKGGPKQQKEPVEISHGSTPAVSTPEESAQTVAVDGPTARRPSKRRRHEDQPTHVPSVDVQPVLTTKQEGASGAAGDTTIALSGGERQTVQPRVRKAKAQVSPVTGDQTPQAGEQIRPPTGAKRRGEKAARVPGVQSSVSTDASSPKGDHVPAPSNDVPGVPSVVDQGQPSPATSPIVPATWRYMGPREDADRLYQRRFGTDDVPEPTMVAGSWAYSLPVTRRSNP
jgi:hypothetical protein